MLKTRSAAFSILMVVVLGAFAWAETPTVGGHWVSAWSAAMHAPLPFPGLPPSPVFESQTIRMVVRPTIVGDLVRIRLSNAFGTTALKIGAAHIAIAAQDSKTVPESDHALRFGGASSVTIPPGALVLSDAIDLRLSPFAEIAVSLFLPEKTSSSTVHFWGQHKTYISGTGEFTGNAEIPNATTSASWYWLADLEVWASDQTAAIVTLGDSITDGVGATQGDYTGWPDLLAKRLAGGQGGPSLAVVNEGIGGNRVLHDGAGVNALARLDRDVLAQPGVVSLIVLEGINDIGWPHMKPKLPNGAALKEPPFVHESVNAQDLIMGLRQIIERARQRSDASGGESMGSYRRGI